MPISHDSDTAKVISNPLSLIYGLFNQANQPVADERDWGVEAYFSRLFQDTSARDLIPLLTPDNIDQIPNHSLCRFRGMVQDMMDPEYYVGAYRQQHGLWQTRKYSDAPAEAICEDAETVIWTRKPLYCSKVRGEAEWCTPSTSSVHHLGLCKPAGGSAKRSRDDGSDTDLMDEDTPSSRKSTRASDGNTASTGVDKDTQKSAPHLHQEGNCIIYVYEKDDSLRLNDVIELVGIKSTAPELAALQLHGPVDAGDLDLMEEEMAARPPTSLVPRIHALSWTKIRSTEDLPVIAFKSSAERQAQVAELRQTALKFLETLLFGDKTAAQYVLLQLVSRTYSRTEAAALGLLSLGLTNCPPGSGQPDKTAALGSSEALSDFGRSLQRGLSTLTPRSLGLPISVAQLNKKSWRPARDITTNRLSSSPLQLAENTHLLLDETVLEAGQLTPLGIRNFETLKTLLDQKKVDYDFSFYTLPVNTDAAVTVLSETKSLLHESLDATLPLKRCQSAVSLAEIDQLAKGEQINSVRAYLSLVRYLDFTIHQPTSSFLENQLVEARKQDKDLDPSTMHTWLTIARLIALSHGCDSLSEKHWQEMRQLEFTRAQRLRSS